MGSFAYVDKGREGVPLSDYVRPYQGSSSMRIVVVAVRAVSLCPCRPRTRVVKRPLVMILILGCLYVLFYMRCQRVVFSNRREE